MSLAICQRSLAFMDILYIKAYIAEMSQAIRHPVILVRAEWDDEASVWVATSTDIAGLAAESPTLEALRDKVLVMIGELIELNNLHSDLPEIPVHILAGQTSRIPNPDFA